MSQSRIGKAPINVPGTVKVELTDNKTTGQTVTITGPKGTLTRTLRPEVTVTLEGTTLLVQPNGDTKMARSLHGLSRTLVSNMVEGVTNGFKKTLEINGVGYKAAVAGKVLKLSLGYSHDIDYAIPAGVTITTPKPTEIVVAGIDKQVVGQTAAEIREYRGPEPYKGKGVKYSDEFIFRKEGKKK